MTDVSAEVLGIPRTHYEALISERDRLAAELEAVTAERNAARKPWCVHLPRGITVAIDAIESVEFDSRLYMNGLKSILVVTLRSGTAHRFEHAPHLLDGVDIYKLHKEICDA